MEVGEIHVFDIHQNPNDSCIVGKNIQPVLGDMFHENGKRAVPVFGAHDIVGLHK